MSRIVILRSALASAFIGGAITWLHGRARMARAPRNVIPIVTPVITMRFAEDMLARDGAHRRRRGVRRAAHGRRRDLRRACSSRTPSASFARSSAIVPYMAFSGGTMIALNAKRLRLGKNAALSAVDPLIYGHRAKHIPPTYEKEQNPSAPARRRVQHRRRGVPATDARAPASPERRRLPSSGP
jgi:hypothetical protein